MKAVICKDAELEVENLPEVEPAKGQAVLDVLRCGICGSDLHARHHCGHMGNMFSRLGYNNFASADEPLVFGHEFCGEVLDYGPGTKGKFKPGTRHMRAETFQPRSYSAIPTCIQRHRAMRSDLAIRLTMKRLYGLPGALKSHLPMANRKALPPFGLSGRCGSR